MTEGMSPADVKAIMNDGDGWGGGAWWIIILFLFVFMGGGWGNNRQNDYSQHATASAQQEILFGQQFGQLNDRLTSIGNGICSLGYDMQGNIGQLGKEVALSQCALGQRIDNGNYALAQQLSDCCCQTQRAIDGVNANIDAKFAAIEKSQLEMRISQLEQENSRSFMREQMCGVVRYPNGYTYNAGQSPFCGRGGDCCY